MGMIRTFIAVELPEDSKAKIGDYIAVLKERITGVKWVKPSNLHFTLKFLGNVAEEIVPDILQAVEKAVESQRSFSIELEGFGAFPGLKNPRVFWIGIKEGKRELADSAVTIDEAMEQLGFSREKRRFSPHLTVGRIKKGVRMSSEIEIPFFEPFGFHVQSITVMKSTLTPGGPIYEPMGIIPLVS